MDPKDLERRKLVESLLRQMHEQSRTTRNVRRSGAKAGGAVSSIGTPEMNA